MPQNSETPNLRPSPLPPLATWASAALMGIGLWILNSGGLRMPPAVVFLGALLLLAAAIILVLNGFRNLNHAESFAAAFILPLALGVGLAVLLLWTQHALKYLAFPYPLDDGEGFCLNQALLLAAGKPLYPSIQNPPYIVTNYPPFFQAVLSIFADPLRPSFLAGRMISVISTILTALAAAGCVRAATQDHRAGWIAALLVISSPVVYFWGALLRVDVLASALGMLALWIAMSATGPRVFWALPLLIASLYTRQSSVEAAIAIAAALILGGNSSRSAQRASAGMGLALFAAWIACAAAILLPLQIWTGSEFWRHTVVYTRTEFFPQRILSAGQWILPSHALMLILALFALPRALTDPRRRMLAFFFLASLATSLLSGKVGSDLNYYLNLVIASACLAGLLAADILRAAASGESRPAWIVPIMLLIPAAIAQSGLMEGQRGFSFNPIAEDYRNGAMIVETLSSVNGPILSEDEGFCLLAGHEVLFNPFIMSELGREGVWDQTPFVRSIENREFDMIMLRFDVNDPTNDDRPGVGTHAGWDRFTPSMERAIADNYRIDYAVSPIFMRRWWFIYRPAGQPSGPDAAERSGEDLLGGTG